MLVGFTVHDGHFFAIGLGHEDSCTLYWESVDPPYFQSRGSGQPRKSVDFAYDGQHTELPGTVLVDRGTAFEALIEFVETGRRSEGLVWEET